MNKGTIYGVSVGPGEVELLTLKAVRIVKSCPVLAAPRTRDGNMAALDILRQEVDIEGKEILPLALNMDSDTGRREAAHDLAEAALRDRLDAGCDVAFLNLGDISIYGSFGYFAHRLAGEYPIVWVPGVTSFCAAAAAAGESLVLEKASLELIPYGIDEPPGGVTRVYMKQGRHLRTLLERLQEEKRLSEAVLVQNCGMEQQRILRDPVPEKVQEDYFSVLIVKERCP